MKKFLIVFLILFCPSVSAIAQQVTKADLQSLEAKIMTLDANITKLQETVTEMDKRLTKVEVTVTEMDKRVSNQISA